MKNIKTKQLENSFVQFGETFEVYHEDTKIGYVWSADGSWWANDKQFDESIEEFKSKSQGIKWLIEYVGTHE